MKTEILITQEEKEDIIAKSVARAIYDFYGGEHYVTVNGKLVKAAAYAVDYAQKLLQDKAEERDYQQVVEDACTDFRLALEWYEDGKLDVDVLLDTANCLAETLPEDVDQWIKDGQSDNNLNMRERQDLMGCMTDVLAGNLPEKAEKSEKSENEVKADEKPANKDKKIKSIILDGKKYEVVDNGSFRKITINGTDYLIDGYFLKSID